MRNAFGDARLLDAIERRQLDRLAQAVLGRPSMELTSIAQDNPQLVKEWISQIRNLRDEIDAEKQALETALERLQSITDDDYRRSA